MSNILGIARVSDTCADMTVRAACFGEGRRVNRVRVFTAGNLEGVVADAGDGYYTRLHSMSARVQARLVRIAASFLEHRSTADAPSEWVQPA